MNESDTVKSYIQDNLDINVNVHVPKTELYQNYKKYCISNNTPYHAENAFHRHLKKHVKVTNYRPQKGQERPRSWRGIKIKVDKMDVHNVQTEQPRDVPYVRIDRPIPVPMPRVDNPDIHKVHEGTTLGQPRPSILPNPDVQDLMLSYFNVHKEISFDQFKARCIVDHAGTVAGDRSVQLYLINKWLNQGKIIQTKPGWFLRT